MPNRSPYDDVPEDLMHDPDVLDATAAELDRLVRLLQPRSIEFLKWAVARETASSSATALEAEARGALQVLLEHPDEGAQLGSSEAGADDEAVLQEDSALRDSLERALSQKIHCSLDQETPSWLAVRANDLARTVAVAWVEFGSSSTERVRVLDDILAGKDEGSHALVDDLCRRFEFSLDDTLTYLAHVRDPLAEAGLVHAPINAS